MKPRHRSYLALHAELLACAWVEAEQASLGDVLSGTNGTLVGSDIGVVDVAAGVTAGDFDVATLRARFGGSRDEGDEGSKSDEGEDMGGEHYELNYDDYG